MSTPKPSCQQTNATIGPCITNYDPNSKTQQPCTPTVPSGSTVMIVQNYETEPIVAVPLSSDPKNPMCFVVPAFSQDPSFKPTPDQPKQVPQQYTAIIPSQVPVKYAFYGQNTGSYYTGASSQTTPPSSPLQINKDAPAPATPSTTPSDFVPTDIRSKKPMWVFIIAGVLFLLSFVLMIVIGVVRNAQVMRVYGDLKGAKDDESREMLQEDEALEAEYSEYKGTAMIVIGSIGIALVAGLVVGALFLPGYPLSKYMSYEGCAQLQSQEPTNKWSWSVPPESGIWNLLCKALGACICRSTVAESNCFNYAVTMPSYKPNVWQGALKNPPLSNKCICCDGQMCTSIVNNEPQPC